jgi:adenylate cyclase, class 2
MMSKEIEVKVLGIDFEKIKNTLESLDANFESDDLQQIYTYDLAPISTTFISVIEILKKNIGDKENELARQKLASLLTDLSDLLSEADKSVLLQIANVQSLEVLIKDISNGNIPNAIFESDFENVVSKYDTNPNKWVRLRESGGKTTIALKQIFNRKTIDGIRQHSINDVKEIEIEIDNLEKGKQLLEELGYFHKNYQEKRRVSYTFSNGVKVDIDFWAYIPPYLEIEAATEELVYSTLTKLGFNKEDAKILNADDVYTYYGLDMYSYKELRLEQSP